MSEAKQLMIRLASGITASMVVVSLATIGLIFRDINNMYDEIIEDLDEFKVLANDAWSQMQAVQIQMAEVGAGEADTQAEREEEAVEAATRKKAAAEVGAVEAAEVMPRQGHLGRALPRAPPAHQGLPDSQERLDNPEVLDSQEGPEMPEHLDHHAPVAELALLVLVVRLDRQVQPEMLAHPDPMDNQDSLAVEEVEHNLVRQAHLEIPDRPGLLEVLDLPARPETLAVALVEEEEEKDKLALAAAGLRRRLAVVALGTAAPDFVVNTVLVVVEVAEVVEVLREAGNVLDSPDQRDLQAHREVRVSQDSPAKVAVQLLPALLDPVGLPDRLGLLAAMDSLAKTDNPERQAAMANTVLAQTVPRQAVAEHPEGGGGSSGGGGTTGGGTTGGGTGGSYFGQSMALQLKAAARTARGMKQPAKAHAATVTNGGEMAMNRGGAGMAMAPQQPTIAMKQAKTQA
uniref:Nematode cuticle collagen N-terminal domain-containing protein n=1 Tax=Globodera rostochiensis TaxID=31243 RepID=A0A914HXH6_GLORO